MNIEDSIISATRKNLGLTVLNISPLGKGASGSVYRANCDGNPQTIAVKISNHPELIFQEFEMLSFLKKNTSAKIPEVYFFDGDNNTGLIAMEYIAGISGTDRSLKYRLNKKHLAESIIENLLLIQKAHNDKFGPYNNAVYDTWEEYYRIFAEEILIFSKSAHSEKRLDDSVMETVEVSYKNLDKIFSEKISTPTLIHGDYWMPNFIIDKKSMELLSVVDPFNVMWADPEYELFAMTVDYGKKLHLYETYKSRVKVSDYCDLKIELYALYSELLWYKKLGTIDHSYLKFRAKNLIKEMKKHNLI